MSKNGELHNLRNLQNYFTKMPWTPWTPWTNDNISPLRYTHGVIDDDGSGGVYCLQYPRKIKKGIIADLKNFAEKQKGTI